MVKRVWDQRRDGSGGNQPTEPCPGMHSEPFSRAKAQQGVSKERFKAPRPSLPYFSFVGGHHVFLPCYYPSPHLIHHPRRTTIHCEGAAGHSAIVLRARNNPFRKRARLPRSHSHRQRCQGHHFANFAQRAIGIASKAAKIAHPPARQQMSHNQHQRRSDDPGKTGD